MSTADLSTTWVDQLREILGSKATKSIAKHTKEVLSLLTACENLEEHLPQDFDLQGCITAYDKIAADVSDTTSKSAVADADEELKTLRGRLESAKKAAEKTKKAVDKFAEKQKTPQFKAAEVKYAQLEKRLETFATEFSGADYDVEDFRNDLKEVEDLEDAAWSDGTALKDLENIETYLGIAEKTVTLFQKKWKTKRGEVQKELTSFKKNWSEALSKKFQTAFDDANLVATDPSRRDPHQAETLLTTLLQQIQTEAQRQRDAKIVYDKRLELTKPLMDEIQELASPLVARDYGQRILHLRNYRDEKNFGEAVDLMTTWEDDANEELDELRTAHSEWVLALNRVKSRMVFFKKNDFILKYPHFVQHREQDLRVAETFIDQDKNYPLGVSALQKLERDMTANEQEALALSDTSDYWNQEHLPAANKILQDFDKLLKEVETKWKQDDSTTQGEFDEGRNWKNDLQKLLLAQYASQEACVKSFEEGKRLAEDFTRRLVDIRDNGDPDKRLEKARAREAREADRKEWIRLSTPVVEALEQLRCLGVDPDTDHTHIRDYAELEAEYKAFEKKALTGNSDEVLDAIANMPGVLHLVNTAINQLSKKSEDTRSDLKEQLKEFKERVKQGIGRLSRLWNKQSLPEDLFESLKKDADALEMYADTDNLKLLKQGLAKIKALDARLDDAEKDPQKFVKLEAQLKESEQLLKNSLLKQVFKGVGHPKWKKKRDEIKGKVRSGNDKAIKEHDELLKTLRKSVKDAGTIDRLQLVYLARIEQLDVRKEQLSETLKRDYKSSGKFFGAVDKFVEEARALIETESLTKVESAEQKLAEAESALQGYEDDPGTLVREEWDDAETRVQEEKAWEDDVNAWKQELKEFEEGPWAEAKDAVARANAPEDRLKLIEKFHKKAVKFAGKDDLASARQQLKFANLYAKQTAHDPLGAAKSDLLKGLDAAWSKALKIVRQQVQTFEDELDKSCTEDGREHILAAAKKLAGKTKRVLDALDETVFDLPVRVITQRGTLKEARRQREEGLNFVRKYRKHLGEDPLIQSLLQNPFSPINFRALYNCLNDLDLNLQRSVD